MHPKSWRPTDVNAFIFHQTRYSIIFSCKSCTAIGRERASGGGAGRSGAETAPRCLPRASLRPVGPGPHVGRGVLSVLSLIVRYNARSHTHSHRGSGPSGLAWRGGASTHRAISVVLSRNVAGLTPRDATCRSESAPPRPAPRTSFPARPSTLEVTAGVF